jgi:DNA-binding CsgD family transcriptional regulator
MPAAALLPVAPHDLAVLRRWARSSQLPAVLAQQARILLQDADGASNTEIAQRVGVSRPTVLACRRRYVRRGLEGPARPAPFRSAADRAAARRTEILQLPGPVAHPTRQRPPMGGQ